MKKSASRNTTGDRMKIKSNNQSTQKKQNVNVNGSNHFGAIDERELLRILLQIKNGNFTDRLPFDRDGLHGKICDTINDIISLNDKLVTECVRVSETIGKQGKLTHRIDIPNAPGSWSTGVAALNNLISDLVYPTPEIAHVISSVAKGNLSQEMPQKIGDHKLQGEFARIAKEVNSMVKQLNHFSMEVARVVKEVGSEGKLGGQARVKGTGGYLA